MGQPRVPDPVLLVVAAFSRHSAALDWARQRLEQSFGSIALTSPLFEFNQTRYYERTMGAGLRKCFLAFEQLVEVDTLAATKRFTNCLERELASNGSYPEARPLNLDPGLLSLGKFQLATTKDQSHRVHIGDGMYAESTLRFESGVFQPWPWTYADYRESAVRDFLGRAREWYRLRLRQMERQE
jgi:hypothetical protein